MVLESLLKEKSIKRIAGFASGKFLWTVQINAVLIGLLFSCIRSLCAENL